MLPAFFVVCAQLSLSIEPAVRREEDSENLPSIHLDRGRLWVITTYLSMAFLGQPVIYAEQFIRSRLAEEEEAALAASRHGSRCC